MRKITRRSFIQKAGIYGASGAVVGAGLPGRIGKSVNAQVAPDWLELTKEVAIEPALPIIDPHHHWELNYKGFTEKKLINVFKKHNFHFIEKKSYLRWCYFQFQKSK